MSEVRRAHITLMVKALMDRGGLITLPSVSALLPGCSNEITIGSDLKDNMVIKVAGKKLASIPIADPNYDKKLDDVISKLHLVSISPERAIRLIKKLGATEEYEAIVAGDAKYAYQYADEVLGGPFPAGEKAIAKDPRYAYEYASKILKGPFPAGEAAIATDAGYACAYARYKLKGPFPAGEAAIAINAGCAWAYADEVLKGPFPAGEAAIAQDAGCAYEYAKDVLMLPEAEAKNWRKNYRAKTKRKSAKKGKV